MDERAGAFLKRLETLRVWKQGDRRAPHKPLLLLLALARVSRGEGRLVSYEAIAEPLRRLLREFAPAVAIVHPEYPFCRLRNDGIWEVTWHGGPGVGEGIVGDPSHYMLIDHEAEGGFPTDIQEMLSQDPALVKTAVELILGRHFPDTLHDEILTAIGFEPREQLTSRLGRDPAFRVRVLLAYEYRCAVCGFDLQMDQAPLGLDAAHIRWKQANGPDHEVNGLALCTLHHRLFDRGAFTVQPDLRTIVSRHVVGEALLPVLLVHHGEEIRAPQEEWMRPAGEHLLWHEREVFRAPGRE